jgi:4-amino-4-deoxy-L-arabinose transferase-like glycosyltransferase
MIQRIQSLQWLGAIIGMTLQIWINQWMVSKLIHWILLLPIGMLFFVIFDYNNRKRQIKWSKISLVSMLLCTIIIEVMIRGYWNDKTRVYYSVPIAAFALTYLAMRNVMRDEAKVRSVDRIR